MNNKVLKEIFYTVILVGLIYLCFIVITNNLEEESIYPPRPIGEIEAVIHDKGLICYVIKYKARYEHSHGVCWNKEELKEKWKQ